ncbi:unnamed protein product [Symbiodinium sp. CCMP2592]|nr:unnamed protein product [Symbiodinium sp. CCMP2592]
MQHEDPQDFADYESAFPAGIPPLLTVEGLSQGSYSFADGPLPTGVQDMDAQGWPARFSANGHNDVHLDSLDVRRLPDEDFTRSSAANSGEWLGVIVMAPHCQPTEWAMKIQRGQGEDHFLSSVLDLGPALYQGLFDTVVPIVPQRHTGYAMVMVFGSVTAHIGPSGHVPVILDLSHVGGHYYATVLPTSMAYEDLWDYILPQTWADFDDFQIYVGCAPNPCREGAQIRLQAGDVILAQDRPLEHDQEVSLAHGQVIAFALHGAPPAWGPDFPAMLRSGDDWDSDTALPGHHDPALWLLGDTEAQRFPLDQDGEAFLHLEDGQVLTVEYVREQPNAFHEHELQSSGEDEVHPDDMQAQIRLVPTPCRANSLTESASRQGSGAYREVRILLEALSMNDLEKEQAHGPFQDDISPAAWAIAVWAQCQEGLFFVGWSAHTTAPPDTPYHIGESAETAVTAELLAVAWGLAWVLEYGIPFQVPIEFRYDATAAGGGIFGDQRLPTDDGGTVQALGEPGNELCDLLRPADVNPPIPTTDAYHCGRAFRMQTTANVPLPPSQGTQIRDCPRAEVVFDITAVTYNVLTLFDPHVPHGRRKRAENVGMWVAGKRALMKKQFAAADMWLIGLQETRLPESAVLPDDEFLMLCAGADETGQHGCALWINLKHVYARVLHAPRVAAQGLQAVELFWQARAEELQKRKSGADFVILADANAHLGDVLTAATGEAGSEPENAEGECFQKYLQDVGGCLPSTFARCHRGEHWTWTSPGLNGVRHRLDYVGVPLEWRDFEHETQVWYELESLQARQDHMPLCYSCTFCQVAPAQRYRTAKRIAVRPPRDVSKEGRRAFAAFLDAAPLVPWTIDIDAHYNQQVETIKHGAEKLDAEPVCQANSFYLRQSSLQLIRVRRAYRAYIAAEETERLRRVKLVVLGALRHHAQRARIGRHAPDAANRWLWEIDISLARALERYQELSVAVKAAVKRDRQSYLEGLAQQITIQDLRKPRALYAAVRRAFPKAASSRRSRFQPLPAVKLADGSLASTPEDRAQRWTEFFQEQECGSQVTPSEYIAVFHEPDIPVLFHGPVFDVHAIPTIGEMEQQLHTMKYGKASGPDGLTGELVRVAVPAAVRAFYPVSLKASLGVREPCEWRGGALMTLAKRALATYECQEFRSILLASVMSKAQHRLLRNKLTPAFQEYKTALQAGQLPGTGVDSLILLTRAYQLRAQHRRYASALTFFDVKAAFYRVVRQSLLPTAQGVTDAGFLQVLHSLGVPDHALPELTTHLSAMATLQEAGVSQFTQAQISDLFRGSWFRLDASGPLVATRKGTRPGDPLADMLFAFSFAAYLRSAHQALQAAQVETWVPPSPVSFEGLCENEVPEVGCLAWADDYTHLQMAKNPELLLSLVVQATEILTTHATANGMQLTYAEDKTATLLSANCPRSGTSDYRVPDRHGRPVLRIQDSITKAVHEMPVVSSYRHLGSVAVANATPLAEVQYRYAQARAALRPLQAKLFGAKGIPLGLRRTFLRSLVLTKFTFASASIILQAKQHRRRWCQNFVSLWRGLQKRCKPEDQVHSYDVLIEADSASPLLMLAHARAVLYARLHKQGPQALLFMLHAHWKETESQSWLGQFVWDLRAAKPYSDWAQQFLASGQPVRALLRALEDDPGGRLMAVPSTRKQLHQLRMVPLSAQCVMPPSGYESI